MLSIRNLDFSYDRKNIINDFSLDINSDEVIALIGQSGCGKSTIIKCCADILETKNAIILNEKPIDAKQNKIGLVMQDLGLFTWLNVKDNCLLPYRIKKIGVDSKVIDQLNHVTSQLNIKQLYKRQVNQLSGGQQQRVALARLFTFNPDYILLDEAFSSLDLLNRDEAIKLFISIWNNRKVPTLMVTHSIDEAIFMASKIVILKEEGKIIETIDNPLFQCEDYKQQKEYGKLYYQVEKAIKGEYYEE